MAMCVGDIFGYQNRSVYIISRQKIQHREKKTRRKRKNTWNCRENCYLCSTSYRAVIPPARRRNNKAAPVTTTTTTLTKKVAKKWGYTTRCIYVQCFMYIRHTYTISPQCMLFWSFYARATIYFGILERNFSLHSAYTVQYSESVRWERNFRLFAEYSGFFFTKKTNFVFLFCFVCTWILWQFFAVAFCI